jgi:hypothetical protein
MYRALGDLGSRIKTRLRDLLGCSLVNAQERKKIIPGLKFCHF